ncbi:MAG: redoxin domain-containing protein [Sphingobacteriales bacterium]|nr:MAG: redoxin domain-containing protein [Sphingobacteriales bacterium]
MKKVLFALLFLVGFAEAFAADGYKVQVKFTDVKNAPVYLANYYGQAFPSIFKADSATLDANGVATFISSQKIIGGIYIIILADGKSYFEFLLQNGDDMGIDVTASQLPDGVKFRNTADNARFATYLAAVKAYGSVQQNSSNELAKAKTKADSAAAIDRLTLAGRKVNEFRVEQMTKYPGSLLASIFKAMETPAVPPGKHYLPDGQEDTAFAYRYYKAHYWDKFNFKDDRLVYTPLYDSKLEYYFTNLVDPTPDSLQKEAAILLEKTRGHKEIFKYTLWWLTQRTQYSGIMGMDQAFVYLVENYYMKGDAYWLTKDYLDGYIDRARKIAPNVIGNQGADIKMVDMEKRPFSLYDFNAKYTLIVFWSPECGGCREQLPLVDSVYRAALKDKGVRVVAVRTEGDEGKWKEFVTKKNLRDWAHIYDPERKSNYRAKYDVYGTPIIYLLDREKIIRGKKLDYTNIAAVVEMLEEKENATKKKL